MHRWYGPACQVQEALLPLTGPRGRLFIAKKCGAKDAAAVGPAAVYWTVTVTEVE